MVSQEEQKELFEFKEQPKKRFGGFPRIFPAENMSVTLSMERLILFSIGIIMVAVLVYALGVERGKSLGRAPVTVLSQQPATKPPSSARNRPPEAVQVNPVRVAPAKAAGQVQERSYLKTPGPQSQATERTRGYTIVVGTFSNKDNAAAMVSRIKKNDGLSAFLIQGDSYFQVCIGNYPDKESVQSKKALARIAQRYKGAYFKLSR
ncbi:MAG: SPOR domain-containing protein [Candidatus Omnitrophota bacterium]